MYPLRFSPSPTSASKCPPGLLYPHGIEPPDLVRVFFVGVASLNREEPCDGAGAGPENRRGGLTTRVEEVLQEGSHGR